MVRLVLWLVGALLVTTAWAKTPLYIGMDADMSAVAAEGGRAIKLGALVAINEINQQGGVLNIPLELIVRDHRGNPARGLANIVHFSRQPDLVAVLGGVHTPVALHELPVIHEKKMLYLDPWAAGTGIVDNGYKPNFVFRVSVRDEHAATVLINRAMKKGYRRPGLLLERTGWGRSNQISMSAAIKKQKLENAGVQWFNWRETDLSKQIKYLVNNGADVILLVANAPEGAAAMKGIASLPVGKRLPVLSHWGVAGGAFVSMVGESVLQQVELEILQTFSFLQQGNQQKKRQVLEQYQQLSGQNVTAENVPASVGVAHAYDLVHLLALAIEQSGKTDTDAIRQALESLESYPGLVKHYLPPFSPERHDALEVNDYIMSEFNLNGHLVPVAE